MPFQEINQRILPAHRLFGLVLAIMLVLQTAQAVSARDPWQISHPPAPPQAPIASGSNPFGMVPKFDPDFWKGQLANRVPAGTVLSGILEDDLSSSSNKVGDIF